MYENAEHLTIKIRYFALRAYLFAIAAIFTNVALASPLEEAYDARAKAIAEYQKRVSASPSLSDQETAKLRRELIAPAEARLQRARAEEVEHHRSQLKANLKAEAAAKPKPWGAGSPSGTPSSSKSEKRLNGGVESAPAPQVGIDAGQVPKEIVFDGKPSPKPI